jgi:AraC-like DNA-binding protein
VAISTLGPELLDAAIRLLRLLDTPRDIPVLAPLAEREILYRLLRGDQAARMSQIACAASKLQQVNRAIGWIKRNFREPFSVDVLAAEACMSSSALHQHFRTVTGMSPLQYQKQLRLQEARRLMLCQAVDAAVAGHRVGYESPSQFNREYRRLFGAPPVRDIERLRAGLGATIPVLPAEAMRVGAAWVGLGPTARDPAFQPTRLRLNPACAPGSHAPARTGAARSARAPRRRAAGTAGAP